MNDPSREFSSSEGSLSQFTKNRFFKGKLMTPRIMEIDRSYHSERLQTLNRYITGSGVVSGLDIESFEPTSDGIEITLTPGLALDGRGRPIVVEQMTTTSLPDASSDELHLFIQYNEVPVETVPVPDTDGAIEDDAVPNRVVETFELTSRENPPETSAVTEAIDLSELKSADRDATSFAQELTNRYHEHHGSDSASESDPAVYLGGYERTSDGSWSEITDRGARPYVYDHELLFSLLAQHLTDTDNPHETPVHEPVDPNPDIGDIEDRLADLETSLHALEQERDTFARYTLRKTIKDRARYFATLGDRIEEHHGESSRVAREIVRVSDSELADSENVHTQYTQQLSELLPYLIEIGDLLDGVVTERSLERYLRAVSQLQSSLKSDADLIDLIDADDRVCETVDSFDVLVNVVPDA
ncbi:uncharacterized protein Nmag_0763 [Natrialba magadii ATCC 43099]|uniref:Uncharacterized protein n=2 Tax=Natrialba magadii (strain ATCC 43099 / DSM 3394 / CCM 3739 / CIP 104546 / IAM 13178 / JCM 8861 / NBRC 102185 / NCIMB 2190 / MS3) TaxID=547559 RepID=D3SZL4_NATMM|nr:uncharacterized protein Nmag_0763 [Natrialba magadii ATCC 43099]